MVLEGRLRYRIGELGSDGFHEETLGDGTDDEHPALVPHGATALERTVVLDLFSPPSEKTGIDGADRLGRGQPADAIPSSRPIRSKALSARSRCSSVWAAVTMARRRALSRATVG